MTIQIGRFVRCKFPSSDYDNQVGWVVDEPAPGSYYVQFGRASRDLSTAICIEEQFLDPIAETARFWVYLERGWVKLSIPHGKTLRWGSSSADEEGFHSCYHEWSYHSEVTWYEGLSGRDCDGRYSNEKTVSAPVKDLAADPARGFIGRWNGKKWSEHWEKPATPKWSRHEELCHDYSAQKAGY